MTVEVELAELQLRRPFGGRLRLAALQRRVANATAVAERSLAAEKLRNEGAQRTAANNYTF